MTPHPNTSPERLSFSKRLMDTMGSHRGLPASPTILAREFNAHFSGKPITVHAARKWLVSESIPTQDKLRSLAGWLGVSVEWLRFGGVTRVLPNRDSANDVASPQDSLVRLYLTLPAREREIARDFVGMLVSKSRQRNENRATSGLVSITHR